MTRPNASKSRPPAAVWPTVASRVASVLAVRVITWGWCADTHGHRMTNARGIQRKSLLFKMKSDYVNFRRRQAITSPTAPRPAQTKNVEGSGTLSVTAMEFGLIINPETSEAFTVSPVMAYSPTVPFVPLPSFTTNRFDPETAIASGESNPETSEGFTTAPERPPSTPGVNEGVFVAGVSWGGGAVGR